MNQPPMKDRWIKCISKSGTLRGVAIRATDLVRDLSERQKLSAKGNQALGEVLVGGLLIGSFANRASTLTLMCAEKAFVSKRWLTPIPTGRFAAM
jgi:redox-regulated HSP33 family molecular chaperone